MSRIGLIGTGHIAAPIARLMAAKRHDICVTERNTEVSAALKAELGVTIAEPQAVLDASDIVFLCLRPHIAAEVLTPLTFRADQQIVSVMAAVSAEQLARLCAPAADFVQTIPLGFLETGGCPMAAFGNDRLLADLFEPENPVVKVADESALNAHFAICAMVPGILDLMATGAKWLGDVTGEADKAEFYTTQLMSGFLATMEKGNAGRLAQERDALATEGTLSLQMTETLKDQGAHDALHSALSAIGKRLES
ncbi:MULTISPECIES: NAD(P)-binding domain-containing protein [unclassified Ruegeria]|uniref:NAD(P)-binding domain-containing protein n=1 Tax=unclassified Ruegeria TaxID=2625375 RepID=UPI00149276CA|nr:MULTISPECIES: NAD(P)-binding domain-containing protein [unclassified Ruegeria]NOD47114.1 NAD(P)-binding domain-containing protein [Ruegeria sp. HKCCD5849]NOD51437.1 NAD(P)-binding domain-containing protein [Ruegeria sp. HKCCD5851]NOD69418.1 NAD(P)-binding domain-containing protein [Ruegeria sp. HKCCD7303]